MENKSIIFAFPEYVSLAKSVSKICGFELGEVIIRNFPDEETYIRLISHVSGKNVYLVAGLENPNLKSIPIMFFSALLKEHGAKDLTLVAPYLGYLRQDKIFKEGETITSSIFAKFLSNHIDSLITIDPHLHRIKSLAEIYSIKTKVLHATKHISDWVRTNIKSPLLIGPDEESRQWTEEVAKYANAPYVILKKSRQGDHEVKITFPDLSIYQNSTPVLIDDIISSGATMMEAAKTLKEKGMHPPVCLAVHAIFGDDAFERLKKSNVAKVVTCNSIGHSSNEIDLSDLIADALIKK
jgi:ribose-phosphate pyrophosphokinase